MDNTFNKAIDPSDPSTPPEILTRLARSKCLSTRLAVAENPNTPENILNHLWEKHPASILKNPILNFWELSNPAGFRKHIDTAALLALYLHTGKSHSTLPTHIFTSEIFKKTIERAYSHSDPRIFKYAPFDPDPKNRLTFLNASLSQRNFDLFLEHAPEQAWDALANDPDPEIRLHFSKLLSITPSNIKPPRNAFTEAVRTLANLEDIDIHQHLARSPIIPPDVVDRIAHGVDLIAKTSLSGCLFIEEETLQLLLQDSDEKIRLEFAKYSSLPSAHQILLKDNSRNVRSKLAQNTRLSLSTLSQFDIKDHPSVLKNVFKNPRTNEKLRSRIFTEGHPDVRDVLTDYAIPINPRFYIAHKHLVPLDVRRKLPGRSGLSAPVIAELATDPDCQVRLQIANRLTGQYGWRVTPANLSLLARFIIDPAPEIRLSICNDPRLSTSQLITLSQDEVPEIRIKLAKHVLGELKNYRNSKHLNYYSSLYKKVAPLLLTLAKDSNSNVRHTVACGEEAPPDALGILFDDPLPKIQTSVKQITRFPFGSILDLEKNYSNDPKSGRFRETGTSPSNESLHLFAHSNNPFLRHISARYSRTTLSDLRALVNDPHPVVREAALAKLAMRESKKTPLIQHSIQPA